MCDVQRSKTGHSKLCVLFVFLRCVERRASLHGKEAEVERNVIVDPNLADHEGIDVEEEDFLDRQLLGDKEVESDPPSSLARFVFLCLCVHAPACAHSCVHTSIFSSIA